MVALDRIRLTGLLTKKPRKRGFFYPCCFTGDSSGSPRDGPDGRLASVRRLRGLGRRAFVRSAVDATEGRSPLPIGSRFAGERRRRDLLHGRGHELVLAGVLSPVGSSPRTGSRRWFGRAATRRNTRSATGWASGSTRRATPSSWRGTTRVSRSVRARPARTRDAHGDPEHERWCVADRSVSRKRGLKLSDFPRKSVPAGSGWIVKVAWASVRE